MKKLLIIPAFIMLCGVCEAQMQYTASIDHIMPSIHLSGGGIPDIVSRETTVNSLAYFPADTSFLIEWYSIDTDSTGTQWHSNRNERLYLTDPEAPDRLEEIGGDVEVMGEALRTNYGLN